MADVFAELDEALRQERVAKFWNDNGRYIIGFIVLTILLTAAFSGHRAWDTSVKTKQTSALIALLDSTEFPANILETEKLDLRPGLRGIALINAAGAFLDDKNEAKALTLYERAAQDTKIPAELRQMADLMSVRLLSKSEEPNAAALLTRLNTIANDKNSPWAYHAHLETALILAHKSENYAEARNHLNLITNEKSLPKSLHATAQSLNHIYSLKQRKQDTEKTNAESSQ